MNSLEQLSVRLASHSFDEQVSALREIAGYPEIHDLTLATVQLAGSPHDEVRMWAAEALESSIAPKLTEAAALVETLRSSNDGEICYWSATLLGRLGSQLATSGETAELAVRVLESCLRDSLYLPARERAVWALKQLAPLSKSALPTLRKVAEHSPPRLQRLTHETLQVLDAAA